MERREGSRPPNPALPYREDCWSEGETEALVEAWGDRYIDLNRGNLRQKHWQEVAVAVNSRRGASSARRPPRTDVQCKNRIDTLKKKYKVEKARVSDAGGGGGSQWRFFDRLDDLIGSSTPATAAASSGGAKKPSPSLPLALPLPFHKKGSSLPVASAAAAPAFSRPVEKKPLLGDSLFRRAAAAAAAAKQEYGDDDEEEEEDLSGSSSRSVSPPPQPRASQKRKERGGGSKGDGDGIRDLARAIERYAKVYERVEAAKWRQTMELEKQRMEFTKELEFQRMQIFVDSQVQLEKIKRAKHDDADKIW